MKELIMLLERAEDRSKATTVVAQVRAKIRGKNLFGWRSFIDDVAIDLISYMIQTQFQYSIGAYITCGMQSAMDHCRWCNAKCRRENFEAISLDDDDSYLQIADEKSNLEENLIEEDRKSELYEKIASEYGKALADQLRPIIYNESDKLDRNILKQVRTEEFREFLHTV